MNMHKNLFNQTMHVNIFYCFNFSVENIVKDIRIYILLSCACFECICVCGSVCVQECVLCMCVYVCVHVRACVCMCACVCVCVYVCVYLRMYNIIDIVYM